MKAMHNKCMKAALENGDITEAAAASTSSEDSTGDGAVTSGGAEEFKDSGLDSDPANGKFIGAVHFMKLGDAPANSVPHDGKIKLEGRSVTLIDESDGTGPYEHNIIGLFVTCKSLEPCGAE